MREYLHNLRLGAGRLVNGFLDWITFGRGGKPTDFEGAHKRAAQVADQIIFWMPFVIVVMAAIPANLMFGFVFPNMVILLIGFFGVFQTKLYRIQLDITYKFATEYITAMEYQKNLVMVNRALEQMNTALISDNAMLVAENIRLGGSRQRPDSPTPFGGMTH